MSRTFVIIIADADDGGFELEMQFNWTPLTVLYPPYSEHRQFL